MNQAKNILVYIIRCNVLPLHYVELGGVSVRITVYIRTYVTTNAVCRTKYIAYFTLIVRRDEF